MARRSAVNAAAWLLVGAMATSAGCTRSVSGDAESSRTARGASTISSEPTASAPAASSVPKPGMAWIPAGTLRAGTPPDRTPRVADEEMAGAPVEMGGFYIDLLPWPNEPNAIPTTNVTRDEAEQLCGSKGKRLCTELEWERACKGAENRTYEYGDAYRKDVCGTGETLEQASRRPTGEHAQCKSSFGVAEMHGGVFEWTASVWGRDSKDGAQGVLRGGNSIAGELVGRCANAIGRNPAKKAPTMGLRCCAGTKNSAEVKLTVASTPGLSAAPSAIANAWAPSVALSSPDVDPKSLHAWTWIPVGNEQLVIVTGCSVSPRSCGLVIGRGATGDDAGAPQILATVPTGKDPPETARNGDARHLRIRALDQRGIFSRDITYVYGRVDVGEPKRP